MKYLKRFQQLNEKIIRQQNFDKLISDLSSTKDFTLKSIYDICTPYDIEVVDYETFYKELPRELKPKAPKKSAAFLFGLVNPVTHKIRLVCDFTSYMKYPKHISVFIIKTILEHESIHLDQEQRSVSNGSPRISDANLDPNNFKVYFSNKNEIMAFAQSIVRELVDMLKVTSVKDGMNKLSNVRVYQDIKRFVSVDILNRYKKYIYLYLEQHFKKEDN